MKNIFMLTNKSERKIGGKRFSVILLLLCLSLFTVYGQGKKNIKGLVTDEKNEPLIGVWIKKEKKKKNNFVPDIHFTKVRIFNKEYNIHEFEKKDSNSQNIVLNHNQNFFAVSFVATDFINGENCRYSYKLENFNNVWMDTRSNEAQFTNIPPGDYTLKVKYNDGGNSNDNLIKSIRIIILPPWYQSITAQIIYVLLIIGVGLGFWHYIRTLHIPTL